MADYSVVITKTAGSDLEKIHKHIALDSPQNASEMITRILDALAPLKQFPHRTVAEHQARGLRHPVRSLPVAPYVVYFRVLDSERVIRVLHVRHGARQKPRRFE